ncbi:efflux RND transporter permease subunit [Tabrizicola sp. DMG-N-6]|uniref:Efflux RND transporter permease subunit n=1 Tax=Szabonella alba TaxID=2804194 RepID=A0A8K0V5J4_9RHOB|nr:efflux RND transporter permease subunit [Szabonella alba]
MHDHPNGPPSASNQPSSDRSSSEGPGEDRPEGGILSYFTRHRTLANLLLVLMIVAGLAASTRIRAQFFPDVVISEISVSVAWSGAGAEDVDRGIVQVLEPALLTVDGVTDATSRASEGSARLSLSFEPGHDLMQAAEDVQAAVDSVNNLPAEAEDPVVRRSAWRDQVTDVVISGPVSLDQLGRFADEFVTRLFAEGITRTTIRGLADPQILVEIPSVALIRHDVTLSEVAQAISSAVQTSPAGDVGAGTARVRTGTEARSPEAIAALVLRQGVEGERLTVGDLADVRAEAADRGQATFVGPFPAMTVRVDRNDTGDAIRMQADVERVVAEMLPSLPPEMQIELVRARAEQISGRLALLLDNALMGLGLVVVLLFLFLNARTAFWVAAGIPVALLAAIGVMYAFGLTLNMISLFALIITLGIIVDDAIVVGEHADFRARHLKEPPMVAAERAARRMSMPVIASTLTTVIAFAGLTVVGGRFGEMIADIPFTVIAVLLASLVECFLILPNHMGHALAASAREAWYDWPSRQVNRGLGWFTRHIMAPFTRAVLAGRYVVLALAVLLLSLQAASFLRGDLQFRFFSGPEQASVNGNFAMLPGATREDSLAMMREMQRATETVAARLETEHGSNPVLFALAEIGGGAGRGLASAENKDADLLGGISIDLVDPDFRPYSSAVFVSALQEEVRPHPLLEELSFRGGRFGPGGDALSVDLAGGDAETLKAAAEAMKTALAAYPEVSALEDSLAYDKEELILNLTPQGHALGLSMEDLGRTLRDRLNGIEAATFAEGPRSATIRVELPETELTADFLESTLIRVAARTYVPLADVVTVESRSGFSTIRRENGLRIVSVTGDVSEDDPARAAEVQRALVEEILPRIEADYGVTTRERGLAEQQRDFLGDAQLGLILCLLGIYLVLAWVFASWSRPFVVMSVIPFGLTGALWGHLWWDVPLSLFSVVGLIGMTGIIINDSIVLITTIDEYSARRGLYPAIVAAVRDRLRPVLLTTLTTVLGLAPLLYERSSQAEFLKPTVITLVYGLGFGMVLVLVLVPAVLAIQMDIGKRLRALRRAARIQRPEARPARHLLAGAALGMVLLFAVTLGAAVVTGALPGFWSALMPGITALPAPAAGFGLFLLGAAGLALASWATARLAFRG